MARHAERLSVNARMRQPLRGLRRLHDLDEVYARVEEVLDLLDAGEL